MAAMCALMARLLIIDTSSALGLVAYVDASENIHTRRLEGGAATSQTLFDAINGVLTDAHASVGELSGIAFGAGPGSFSGVRTATAVAQGIATAQSLPVFAISSLDYLASTAIDEPGTHLLSVIDARMGEVYVRAYRRTDEGWSAQHVATVLHPTDVPAYLLSVADVRWDCVGQVDLIDLPDALRGHMQVAQPEPERYARFAATYAHRIAVALDPADAQPEYVRNKVALTTQERVSAQAKSVSLARG